MYKPASKCCLKKSDYPRCEENRIEDITDDNWFIRETKWSRYYEWHHECTTKHCHIVLQLKDDNQIKSCPTLFLQGKPVEGRSLLIRLIAQKPNHMGGICVHPQHVKYHSRGLSAENLSISVLKEDSFNYYFLDIQWALRKIFFNRLAFFLDFWLHEGI